MFIYVTNEYKTKLFIEEKFLVPENIIVSLFSETKKSQQLLSSFRVLVVEVVESG